MLRNRWMLTALLFLGAASAFAQDDEVQPPIEPPHAGQLREAGPYFIELVTRPNRLTAYISDRSGNKAETRAATATAVITTGKTQYTLKLRPVADNVLRGKGKFMLAPDSEIMVALNMPNHTAVEYARFQPRQEIRASVSRKSTGAAVRPGKHR